MNREPLACDWVRHPSFGATPTGVAVYRLQFEQQAAERVRLWVSADERFDLTFDGEHIGTGPHRGDRDHWNYHIYELDLTPGPHTILAKVWSIGTQAWSPFAQFSLSHGFVCCAPNVAPDRFNTGRAAWLSARLNCYTFAPSGAAWGSGARVRIDGTRYPWSMIDGGGDDLCWTAPVASSPALTDVFHKTGELHETWSLQPTPLPAMNRTPAPPPKVRCVEAVTTDTPDATPYRHQNNHEVSANAWQAMLDDGRPLHIAPNQTFRALLDLERYRCAFAATTVSGGVGARIHIRWAESLYVHAPHNPKLRDKGHRSVIDEKYFRGMGNEYICPGGASVRRFEPLWWEAGRYVEVFVRTLDEPLVIHSLNLIETGYPLNPVGAFSASDPTLGQIHSISLRSLQMCSHETHMDCPYYEQLQYVGDTRLQALLAYVEGHDDRLQRRAIELFDHSRLRSGLTQSRYPSRSPQIIPPFSLLWIGMVHDHWMYRADPSFVRNCLAGTRAVLDAHLRHVRFGLVAPLPGWNFLDWVPGFDGGVPPGPIDEPSASLNLLAIIALRQAADLERVCGLPGIAELYEQQAKLLFSTLIDQTWDARHDRFQERPSCSAALEHSQALALLTGLTSPSQDECLLRSLLSHQDLARTTVYFSHYLFEALTRHHRADQILLRLTPWREMLRHGLTTTIEAPEPSRSDCHAWSAHPAYHFHASILGIRPAEPGWAHVIIRPQLGSLTSVHGRTAHPRGTILTQFDRHDDWRMNVRIQLPRDVEGRLTVGQQTIRLAHGINELEIRH